jgi:predicted Zn-dependent peptidase
MGWYIPQANPLLAAHHERLKNNGKMIHLMKKYRLRNGMMVIEKKVPSQSVVLEVLVKVGSNNEKEGIRGISHFLEHMLFEGTKKRLDSSAIASEIEGLGGSMNAYTAAEMTAYHIKVLRKHFDIALDVLSDMMLHSTFPPKFIEKEKKVILKEIHMVYDDPRFYKWVLFQQTLFKKHPERFPTLGSVKDVSGMTREKMMAYHRHHYTPDNMTLVVVGNVAGLKKKIAQAFAQKKERHTRHKLFSEPRFSKVRRSFEKRPTKSAYTVLGFLACSRNDKDAYAIDLIEAVLGRGQSGRAFETIRNKHGLAYDVGVRCELGKDHGYIAAFASTDKKAVEKATDLMLKVFREPITRKEFEDARTFIEGNYTLENENTEQHADELCYWEFMGDAKLADSYVKNIKKVSYRDVLKAQKKYFSKAFAVAVVGPK